MTDTARKELNGRCIHLDQLVEFYLRTRGPCNGPCHPALPMLHAKQTSERAREISQLWEGFYLEATVIELSEHRLFLDK